jgi:GAF domain-containing protein
VVGLEIDADEGVAGYVFQTGQPIALGEATSDPRFGRVVAEQTGYVPRSLIAVPLGDEAGTLGVLEVLDRRDGAPFDLRDLDAAAVFARQATVAIRATRLERDAASLLAGAIRAIDTEARLSAADVAALAGLDDEGSQAWALADAIARIRESDPGQLGLVLDIVDALGRRSGRPAADAWRRSRR